MKIQKIILNGSKDAKLSGLIWLPDDEQNLYAMIQITHGMTEHIGRYEKLAKFLTSYGIGAAGFDLRGHGHNPSEPDCASFGEGGWEASLEDMHLFHRELQKQFPQALQIMLGFSLGSFLLREYLNRYEDTIAGAVIIGTGTQPRAVLSIIMAIIKTQIQSSGFNHTTPLVRKISFGSYNQKFAPNRTEADWLCADKKELDLYRNDPLCRKYISSGLFWQLLDSMKRTGQRNSYEHWKKDIPILLMSGEKDAVGDFGKGILRVQEEMQKAGIKNVKLEMFVEARHDLLHEEESGNAEKARQILKAWILEI